MKKGAEIALLAFFCLFSAVAIAAGGISIDCSEAPYSSLPAVQGIGNSDEEALQEAAGVAIAGAYRSLHGASSLPVGTQIEVTWQNGSSEKMLIELVSSTVGVSPIPGTQKAAGVGGGGGGGLAAVVTRLLAQGAMRIAAPATRR
jgi:hypothetical protein